jgi:hypothetical protein
MANKSGIHIKKSHKGAFTKKAKAAGMSVQEFASHVHAHPENYSGLTRKQASFAHTAKTKFKHQAGGYQPQIANTNPGMEPIEVTLPENMPMPNLLDHLNPYGEPVDPQQQQQQPGPQGQQQNQQSGFNAFRKKASPWVDRVNSVASGATALGNMIQNGKQTREEKFRFLRGITPKYMENMEGSGLNNNPAYTMYGGPSDMATYYTGNMHGEGTTVGIHDKSVGPNFRQYSRGIESDVSDMRTEEDVPVAGKPGKMPRRYEFGGPGPGDYERQLMEMMFGGADFGVPQSYSDMDNEDYGYTGIAHNGPWGQNSVYRAGGAVSPDKAKEILHDGTIHGQPITDKQRRYFGWIAGGGKKAYGGWTQEGFMFQTGGPTPAPPPAQQQPAPAPAQQSAPAPAGGHTDEYYQNSATLGYYKGLLNDKLKAKNPQAYSDYLSGLQKARATGDPNKVNEYTQSSQYNEHLSPDEIKKALGDDKNYQRYLNSVKYLNSAQGGNQLSGVVEGNNDISSLNYGRRFMGIPLTTTYGVGVTNNSAKNYSRAYNYNPQTGQVDISEQGDISQRPQGFSPVQQQQQQQQAAVAGRKYGGRKYQTGGRSFMTGPAMQFGGEGFAVGDEIEMSAVQIAALKKQGYKFEEL